MSIMSLQCLETTEAFQVLSASSSQFVLSGPFLSHPRGIFQKHLFPPETQALQKLYVLINVLDIPEVSNGVQ